MKKYLCVLLLSAISITACSSKEETLLETKIESSEETHKETSLADEHKMVIASLENDGKIYLGDILNKEDIISLISIEGQEQNPEILINEEDLKAINEASEIGIYDINVEAIFSDGSILKDIIKVEIIEKENISLYSGKELNADQVDYRPFMVMIDNSKEARNQASLSMASIIWEMRVEGNYTRYLALFEGHLANENINIGPIRSARPNFATVVSQYGGIYIHHGGSPDGESLISTLGIDRLSGMQLEGSIFNRYFDTGKYAPHNSYVNLQNVKRYSDSIGFSDKNNGKGFKFNSSFEELNSDLSANKIRLSYDPYNYIDYEYDADSKTYNRYREGVLMVDEIVETKVTPTNIIVQFVESYPYDSYGRMAFNSVGEGKAYYISGGKYEEVKWSKSDDHTNPTQFLRADGSEIELNPGQTFIQVIDPGFEPIFE